MGIAPKGGGGVKACQDGLEHFFPRLPVWQRGGGLGNAHIGPKGASQNLLDLIDTNSFRFFIFFI